MKTPLEKNYPSSKRKSGSRRNVEQILKQFEELERSLKLGCETVQGVHWWDVIRYPLYKEIITSLGYLDRGNVGSPKKRHTRDPKQWLAAGKKILSMVGIRSPLWIRRNNAIIFGHPRRKFEDGEYIDIYSDPFIELLPSGVRASVIERSFNGGHLKPCRTRSLYHIEPLLLLSKLMFRWRAPKLSCSDSFRVQSIDNKFYEKFELRLKLQDKVAGLLRAYTEKYHMFRLFFRIKKPSHVVIVVSAGFEAVVAAAKAEQVPTIELQHGSPARGKMNYDYSSGIQKHTFPDWFVSFGPFWTSDVSLPIPTSRVLSLGFPYLTTKINSYSLYEKKERLVIISQGAVASQLVRFACSLAARLGGAVEIVYIPHPQEGPVGELGYARTLEESGVRVARPEEDLYKLLATARWQVGVYSTALYEGVALGAACFVLKVPGYEHMGRLVDRGLATYVERPEDVDLDIRISREEGDQIFAKADAQAVADLFETIAEKPPRNTSPCDDIAF